MRAVFATAIRARGETLRLKSSLVTIAIVCLVSLAIFSEESHTGLDDAYITYQFAENLAQGYGFVFNRTDAPVLGTSTPLYAGLLAIGAFFGADVPRFSMLLGGAGWTAVLVLVVAISWELGRLAAGVSAALMWSVTPLLVRSSEGMETSIYIALILGAILATHRSHPRTGLILAASATLTRPDGIAVFAAVAMLMVVERKWSWRVAAPGVLLLTTWLIFATYWFGNPLPTSGLAKIGHEVSISGRFSLLSPVLVSQALPAASGVRLIPYRTTIVVGLVLAVFVGALLATQKRLAAMLVWWVALYVAGYWFLEVPDFWWYYAPIAIVFGLFFWLAVAAGIAAAEQVMRNGRARFAGPIVFVLGVGISGVLLHRALSEETAEASTPPAHRLAGEWFRQHAQAGDSIVGYEVGTIAFLSKVRTIDLLGLTEPRARQFLRARDYAWAIRDSPSYVFANENAGRWPVALAIFQLPEFALNYRPVARFRFREGNDYVIYRRSREARPVTSADPWKAEWLDLHYPSSITHSEIEVYSIVVRNLSRAVWQTDSDDAINVTYHWHNGSGVADMSKGERTALPCAVEPGSNVLVGARVKAPATPGEYVLQWDLFRKGYGYFSDHGFVVPGEVVVVR